MKFNTSNNNMFLYFYPTHVMKLIKYDVFKFKNLLHKKKLSFFELSLLLYKCMSL